MKIQVRVLILFAFITLSGCNGSTGISHIRLNDPDAGIAADIIVNRDGTFSQTVKNGNVTALLDGSLRSVDAEKYEVTANYERKTYTSETTFKSEKLNFTLTTKSGSDIPIGKRPAEPSGESTENDNPLRLLSIQLIAPNQKH